MSYRKSTNKLCIQQSKKGKEEIIAVLNHQYPQVLLSRCTTDPLTTSKGLADRVQAPLQGNHWKFALKTYKTPVQQRLPHCLICEWQRKPFLAATKAKPRKVIIDWNMLIDKSFFSTENPAYDSKIGSDVPQTQHSLPKRRPLVIITSGKKNTQSSPTRFKASLILLFLQRLSFFEFPGVYVACELSPND